MNALAVAAIVLSNAWSRPAVDTGVVYVTIANRGAAPDRLDGARTPVARVLEVHESIASSATMNGMKMTGVMSMEPVSSLTIPPHASVTFRPGGYHLMAIDLRSDLRPNERFTVQLHFAKAGWKTVGVFVRPI